MSSYDRLPSNSDEDVALLNEGEKRHSHSTSKQSSNVWTILVVLLLLNVLVASGNAFYSVKTSHVLQQYTRKDPSELPRPDPFVGLKGVEKKPGKLGLSAPVMPAED